MTTHLLVGNPTAQSGKNQERIDRALDDFSLLYTGMTELPAIVAETDEARSYEMEIAENIQREAMTLADKISRMTDGLENFGAFLSEAMAARIERDAAGTAPRRGGPVHLGEFLTDTWLPTKRRHVRASTSYRYSWMVDNYINPSIGHVPLRRQRRRRAATFPLFQEVTVPPWPVSKRRCLGRQAFDAGHPAPPTR